MGKRPIENHELVLKNAESFSIELFLLAYPLLLISGDILYPPHYVLIILALICGIGLPFLFHRISYSVPLGLFLSLVVAMPFLMIGIPVAPMSLVIAYVLWRLHTNFSAERHARWNFLAINTIVFTAAYLMTTIYLTQPEKTEFLHLHIQLFIMTTVFSIIFRYIIVLVIGIQTENFQFKEVHKMFGKILGIGTVSFLVVYYFMESVFSTMVALFTFLFGDIFNKTASLLPEIHFQEQSHTNKSEEFEELQLPDSSDSIDLGLYLTITAIIIVTVFVIALVIKRKVVKGKMQRPNYRLTVLGIRMRDKKKSVKNNGVDHLKTVNAVRMAYQAFEKDAQQSSNSRLAGETVKEWFERMNWDQHNRLISIYDKVRYGSLTISEEESNQFVEEINEIKKTLNENV